MNKTSRVAPLVLSLLAVVWVAATMIASPVPGPSSSNISGYAGLQPFRSLTTPLWGALVQLIASVPFVPLWVGVSALNAICAALAVYLLARILMDLPYRELAEDTARGMKDDTPARAVAAGIAAAYFMASASFQAAYAMPQPDALALPLLAAAWLAFQRYLTRNQMGGLYLCAALLSIGAIESASVAFAAPIFALYAFVVMAVRGHFTVRTVAVAAACALVGLVVLGATLALYYQSDVADWREARKFKDVWMFFRSEYLAAGPRSIPRQGWLVILLFALLPIPVVFSRGIQQKADASTEFGLSLLRFLVLPGLAAIILFELPGAPNRIAQTPFALLTPYAAAALWFGRLMGIAFIWLAYPQQERRGPNAPPAAARPIAYALALVVLVAAMVAAARNVPRAVKGNARVFAALVDRAVSETPDGAWLLSDGLYDDAIRIRARDRGKDIRILSLGALPIKAYTRFLHARHGFADPDWIAAIGPDAMLRTWITQEMQANRPPVVMSLNPIPVPDRYRVRRDGLLARVTAEPGPDVEELARALEGIERDSRCPPLNVSPSLGLSRVREWTVRSGARWSNEVGVDLYAAGETNLALRAFELALALQPDHLAARINRAELRRLAGETISEEEKAAIERGLAKYPRGAVMIALRSQYGRIVLKNAEVVESAEWAGLGYLDRAAELTRQSAYMGDSVFAKIDQAIRAAAAGDIDVAEDELEAVLAQQPNSLPHLRALFRIQTGTRQFEDAQKTIARLQSAGASTNEVALATAQLHLLQGKAAEALHVIDEILKREPLNPEAALLRAWVLAAAQRVEEWRAALATLEQASNLYVPGLLYLAEAALNNRDRAAALRYLERAHAVQPGARQPLEMLLSVELGIRDPDQIEQRARSLLALDPDNPLAWYSLGIAMVKRERWLFADEAFRKAAEKSKAPQLLNDWAWTLRKLGRLEEALEKSTLATELAPGQPVIWATRGRIAADLGRHEMAIECFERVRSLTPRVAREVLEALSESYKAIGNTSAAARVSAEIEQLGAFATPAELRAD